MVLIPALLSDGAMYREVIEQLGGMVEAQVMVLSEPTIQDNVAAVLAVKASKERLRRPGWRVSTF
ncbi:hypothetical protein [Belnapia moabensis]|uniref:hypothetical protein n=1 Tax=Belnapia moabensis TaxID=365533 RepID=UPI0005BDEBDF|nr:hypothetical protein [Belnapia moabensis]